MMGAAMTPDGEPGRGERRLNNNRRRYRNVITGLCAAGGVNGMVLGIALGMHFGRYGFHDRNFPDYLHWLAIGCATLFVVSAVVGSWLYFDAIDELELEANKMAGLVGLNVYCVLFMTWWPLAQIGATPEPNDGAIFLITMAATIAAFCWRRFR